MPNLLIPQAVEIPEILFEHPPYVEQPKQGLQLLGAGPLDPGVLVRLTILLHLLLWQGS